MTEQAHNKWFDTLNCISRNDSSLTSVKLDNEIPDPEKIRQLCIALQHNWRVIEVYYKEDKLDPELASRIRAYVERNKRVYSLYKAIEDGNLRKLRTLKAQGINLDDENEDLYSPLCMAIQSGKLDIIQYLLNEKNVNAIQFDGTIPFHLACEEGDLRIVKYLHENGADLNTADNKGITPLSAACACGHKEVLEFLIDKELTLHNSRAIKYVNSRLLGLAAFMGHKDIAELLIKKGANVNPSHDGDQFPLYAAVMGNQVEMARFLIKNGADVNFPHEDNPLYLAAEEGNFELVKVLLESGSRFDDGFAKRTEGYRPLYDAAKNGHLNVVNLLLEKGAYVNTASPDGVTAVQIAASSGHADIVKVLIESGADVTTCFKPTPLYEASENNENHFDNLTSKEGFSPLYLASSNGHIEVVKVLLQYYPELYRWFSDTKESVSVALANNHFDIVKLFAENGTSLDGRPSAWRKFIKAVSNKKINVKKLDLSYNPLSLYTSLLKLSNSDSLIDLDLSYNHEFDYLRDNNKTELSIPEIVNFLEKNKRLISLGLKSTPLNKSTIQGICHHLRQNNSLSILKLGFSYQTDEYPTYMQDFTVNEFIKVLQLNHTLSELELGFLNIQRDTFDEFCSTIEKHNFSLINLSDTKFIGIDKERLEKLEGLLRRNKSLYPFLQAVRENNLDQCKKLLADDKLRKNLDVINYAMYIACQKDFHKMIELLLESGANIENVHEGSTPLLKACEYGNFRAARVLLEHGANINAKNQRRQTVFEFAKDSENIQLTNYIENFKRPLPPDLVPSPENYVVLRVWINKNNPKENPIPNASHLAITIHVNGKETYINHCPDSSSSNKDSIAGEASSQLQSDLTYLGAFPDEYITFFSLDTNKMLKHIHEFEINDQTGSDKYNDPSFIQDILEAGGFFEHLLIKNEKKNQKAATPAQITTLVKKAKKIESILYPETNSFMDEYIKNLKSQIIEVSKSGFKAIENYIKLNPDIYNILLQNDPAGFSTFLNEATKYTTLCDSHKLLRLIASLENNREETDSKSTQENEKLMSQIDELLESNYIDYSIVNKIGYNALHLAISKGNLKLVEKIYVNAPELLNINIKTAVSSSTNKKQPSVLDKRNIFFFPHVKSIRKTPPLSPLDLAIEYNEDEIINFLVAQGAMTNSRDLEPNYYQPFVKIENEVFDQSQTYFSQLNDEQRKGKNRFQQQNNEIRIGTNNQSDMNKLNKIISKCYRYFQKQIKFKHPYDYSSYVKPKVQLAGTDLSLDCEETLKAVINDPDKLSILLLGKPGSGKSLVSQLLARDYWKLWLESKDKQPSEPWIPLWIRLPSIKDADVRENILLKSYLRDKVNLSNDEIETLQQACKNGNCHLLTILDGADEVSLPEDYFYLMNGFWSDWENIKVIATSRPDTLTSNRGGLDWMKIACLSNGNSKNLSVLNLDEFNEDQIDLYLKSTATKFTFNSSNQDKKPDWSDWKTYKYYLTQIPPLIELCKTPQLLNLICTILPEVITHVEDDYSDEDLLALRNIIYDRLVNYCVDYQVQRLLQDKTVSAQLLFASNVEAGRKAHNSEELFLKSCIMKYLKNLAKYSLHKNEGIPLKNADTLNRWLLNPNMGESAPFQSSGLDETMMKIIRSSCLLILENGNCNFIDPSFLEYFSSIDNEVLDPSSHRIINQAIRSKLGPKEFISYDKHLFSLLLDPFSEHPDHTFIIEENINSKGQCVLRRYELSVIDKYGHDMPSGYATVVVKPKIKCETDQYEKCLTDLCKRSPEKLRGFPWSITRSEARLLRHDIKADEGTKLAFNALGKFGDNCYTWARKKLLTLNNNQINEDLAPISTDSIAIVPLFHLFKSVDGKTEKGLLHEISSLLKCKS